MRFTDALRRSCPLYRALLSLLIVTWSAAGAGFTGIVVGVTDGDTLTVLNDRIPLKIRLHGIDCPERGQPFSQQAKQLASHLAFGKQVLVRPTDVDRYGRIVAEVTLPDGRFLNHELVRSGMAWWYQRYAPGDAVLRSLEAEARRAKRGIWSAGAQVPPWLWRGGLRASPAR